MYRGGRGNGFPLVWAADQDTERISTLRRRIPDRGVPGRGATETTLSPQEHATLRLCGA